MGSKDRDTAIKELLTVYRSKSGKIQWTKLAVELNRKGFASITGAKITPNGLRMYVKDHPELFGDTVSSTADQPSESEDKAKSMTKAKNTGMAVKSTADIPQDKTRADAAKPIAVTDTATLPTMKENQMGPIVFSHADKLTLNEMIEWFKSRKEDDDMTVSQTANIPPKFPETLPSYSGKTKTSCTLIPDRKKIALERAKSLWPGQNVEISDLLSWLLEKFIGETESRIEN